MNIMVSIPNICNLNCPYCYSRPGASKELIDVDMWTKGLLNVPGWPHSWSFCFGEPTADPGCVKIAISLLERGDKMAFLTNLTNAKVLEQIPEEYRDNFSFSASFHPHYWSIDEFIDEYKKYTINKGFTSNLIQFVSYPPYVPYLREWKKKLEEVAPIVWMTVFNGIYNNKKYPEAYTDKEKQIVYETVTESCKTETDINKVIARSETGEKKTRRCRVGMDYMNIVNNGTAYACWYLGERGILGNIRDGITLLNEPIVCDQLVCKCYGMWQYIVEEDR